MTIHNVVFDALQEDFKLNDNATVGMFMSQDPDYRYFRLDPRIVECYSSIVESENKNSDDCKYYN